MKPVITRAADLDALYDARVYTVTGQHGDNVALDLGVVYNVDHPMYRDAPWCATLPTRKHLTGQTRQAVVDQMLAYYAAHPDLLTAVRALRDGTVDAAARAYLRSHIIPRKPAAVIHLRHDSTSDPGCRGVDQEGRRWSTFRLVVPQGTTPRTYPCAICACPISSGYCSGPDQHVCCEHVAWLLPDGSPRPTEPPTPLGVLVLVSRGGKPIVEVYADLPGAEAAFCRLMVSELAHAGNVAAAENLSCSIAEYGAASAFPAAQYYYRRMRDTIGWSYLLTDYPIN